MFLLHWHTPRWKIFAINSWTLTFLLWNKLFFFPWKEGKIIKKSSGFSGKGFKFDETEQALANERKKLQKAALGLQDSDDEDAAVDVSIVVPFVLEGLPYSCFNGQLVETLVCTRPILFLYLYIYSHVSAFMYFFKNEIIMLYNLQQ